jgi:hypothetical protein
LIKPSPLWGNFVAYADSDLLAFAWLYAGGLRVPAYYPATQALEKYLKALALSVVDPDGMKETVLNNGWVRTHDLLRLGERCSDTYKFYGEAPVRARLKKFAEFDQVARYPWTSQLHGNGFTSEDVPAILDLISHLRSDLPILLDDFLLGVVLRGHHHGHPECKTNEYLMSDLAGPVSALRTLLPKVDMIVRR